MMGIPAFGRRLPMWQNEFRFLAYDDTLGVEQRRLDFAQPLSTGNAAEEKYWVENSELLAIACLYNLDITLYTHKNKKGIIDTELVFSPTDSASHWHVAQSLISKCIEAANSIGHGPDRYNLAFARTTLIPQT
jgi:hypothetical protein